MNLAEAYEILEVDSNTSDELLKDNFRWLIKFYHPDCGAHKDGAETRLIIEAYKTVRAARL
jgi:curved DNA-binding protein CbpA